jgi:hypothetical protein
VFWTIQRAFAFLAIKAQPPPAFHTHKRQKILRTADNCWNEERTIITGPHAPIDTMGDEPKAEAQVEGETTEAAESLDSNVPQAPVAEEEPPQKAEQEEDDEEDLFGDPDESELGQQPPGVATTTDTAPPSQPSATPAAIPDAATTTASPGSAPATSPTAAIAPQKSPSSIPRKQMAYSPPSKPNNTSSPASASGGSHGLPVGVTIPKSAEKLLNGKLLDTLNSLPINLINDALTEYDDAVEVSPCNQNAAKQY